MTVQLAPETDRAVLDEHCVADSAEILSYLKQLRDRKPLMALFAHRDYSAFVVTELLAVDPGRQQLVFDFATDAARRAAILDPGSAVLVAYLDQVKVQFDADELAESDFDGHHAITCAVPHLVFRLQRRETFRVRPPVSIPASCVLPPIGMRTEPARVRVLDISVGGVALLLLPEDPQLAPGDEVEGARLELPDHPPILCGLRVCSTDRGMIDTRGALRIGCEFRGLDSTASRALQVYVFRAEKATRPPLRTVHDEAGADTAAGESPTARDD